MVLGFILFVACLLIVGFVFILLLILLFLYGWKTISDKKQTCHVNFDSVDPYVVGEPISFRISLARRHIAPRRSVGTILCKSEANPVVAPSLNIDAEEFLGNFSVEIRQALAYHSTNHQPKIEFVKELDSENLEVVVKFSVRKAGLYLITVTHKGARASGSPYRKRFKPSSIEASNTVFLRPSPTIVCIVDEEISYEIQPRDKFGNDCDRCISFSSEPNLQEELKFIVKKADEVEGLSVESKMGVLSGRVSHVFITKPQETRIELVIVVHQPGIYKGRILCDEKPIISGQFDILSITRQENNEVLDIRRNNPAWTPHQACMLAMGEELEAKIRKAYLFVSPKLLYVQEYVLKVFPLKIAIFRVSPMTKINMIIKRSVSKDSADIHQDYTFSLTDGVQPKVSLQMEASKARIVLALYFYFLQNRLGGSENFEGKKRIFYQELRETMQDIRITSKQISVNRASLVFSSMSATKYFRKSDWCKNFGIRFEEENGYDYGGLRREWLELQCVQFFQNNPFGMFSSIGTSRLVHPNCSSSRVPIWNLKHYEFAGKIVGKCLFESSCGDVYTQMVNARFSRSFLAQVLGMPPNYQHFEQDDPELYVSKVKYILDNDVTEMELTFTEEEYDRNGKLLKAVDLIPKGSMKIVTIDNKEQYLNALAQYRLTAKIAKEIDAFKKGLYEIVPEELLTSFDENELELLMCGRSEFDIEDLKENHVKDWNWGMSYNKLFSWFCTAVSNMTDDERARLLQFTTGSSLLPHGGFKNLNPKFKISISNEYGKLIRSHTCFNQLILSDHPSYEEFERCLRLAITEGAEGFSFT